DVHSPVRGRQGEARQRHARRRPRARARHDRGPLPRPGAGMTAASLIRWDGVARARNGARRRAILLAVIPGVLGAVGTAVGGATARRVWIEAALLVTAWVTAAGPWR